MPDAPALAKGLGGGFPVAAMFTSVGDSPSDSTCVRIYVGPSLNRALDHASLMDTTHPSLLLLAAASLLTLHCSDPANAGGSSSSSTSSSGASVDPDGGTADSGNASASGGADSGVVTPPTKKIVFVTSDSFTGNLKSAGAGGATGLIAGDKLCAQAAARAKLTGSFHAWLSSDTIDAKDRLQSNGPWYTTDGTAVVFSSTSDLTTGPKSPILDETGKSFSGYVWTGSFKTGFKSQFTCKGWESDSDSDNGDCGNSALGDWSHANTIGSCSKPRPIYCFQD